MLCTYIACFCIEPDEEFVGQCDTYLHLGFAFLLKPVFEGREVGFQSGQMASDKEEDIPTLAVSFQEVVHSSGL